MAEQAEEKRLPASDKKLREAHQKGQVSHSKDLVSAFTLVASLGYVYMAWPYTLAFINELFDTIATPLGPDGVAFWDVAQRAFDQAWWVLLLLTTPLVLVIFASTLVIGWIATGGPVFSFDTIKPRVENINPAEGLKKIFSKRNVIEFVKGIAKVVIISAVLLGVLTIYLQPLFVVPSCGQDCVEPTLLALLIPLGVAVALAFVVIGALDIPIQRWLFMDEMRMTMTEYKRELKDMEGDPMIRQVLQRQRREAVVSPTKIGLRHAVVVLASGDVAVGLRYVAGETPIPVVVSKGRDVIGREMINQAWEADIKVIEDGTLTEGIYETARIGDYIGEAHFTPVVKHLVRLGLT